MNTFLGANDDPRGALEIFSRYGYSRDSVFIHLDAALNGGWWYDSPDTPKFKIHEDFDSISVSGHKWFGGIVCGLYFVTKFRAAPAGTQEIAYVKLVDRMISGSRNGSAAVIWQGRMHQFDWKHELERCIQNAKFLEKTLTDNDIRCLRNFLFVVFPKPTAELALKYQLMVVGGNAQVICMPHITEKDIGSFLSDYFVEVDCEITPKSTSLLDKAFFNNIANN